MSSRLRATPGQRIGMPARHMCQPPMSRLVKELVESEDVLHLSDRTGMTAAAPCHLLVVRPELAGHGTSVALWLRVRHAPHPVTPSVINDIQTTLQ
jgi:hypothetical protein